MDKYELRRLTLADLVSRYATQAEFARVVGIAPDLVSRYLKGKRIGEDMQGKIKNALGLAPGFMTMSAHVREDGQEHVELPLSDKYLFIPRLNVHAAAGNGDMNDDHIEVMNTLAFRRDWLARKNLKPENLEVYEAVGDSMAPHIENGDVVLVQLTDEVPRNNEVWVIWQRGLGARVKRLLFRENGDLIIRSDNPDKGLYPDEIIPGHMADQVNTIGKMVWRGG